MKREEVKAILQRNTERIRSFHVRSVYLFGSVVRAEATDTSDVDLLVEFDPDAHIGLFGFARLQRMLSEMLGCEVDLATISALHRSLKDRIMEEAIHALWRLVVPDSGHSGRDFRGAAVYSRHAVRRLHR